MKIQWKVHAAGAISRHESLQAIVVDGHLKGGADIIAELGSIEMRFLNVNVRCTREFHQGLFWKNVDLKLDRLALQPRVRKSIESQLAEKVPRPGDDWALWGVVCIPRYE